MKLKQFAIAAGFSIALPGWVLAAGMAGQEAASFESLDTNADGYISAEEAQAHQGLYNAWQDVDADANNQVDQAEFSAFEQQMESPAQEPGMGGEPGVSETPHSGEGTGLDVPRPSIGEE